MNKRIFITTGYYLRNRGEVPTVEKIEEVCNAAGCAPTTKQSKGFVLAEINGVLKALKEFENETIVQQPPINIYADTVHICAS